jgi:hypothetical protein
VNRLEGRTQSSVSLDCFFLLIAKTRWKHEFHGHSMDIIFFSRALAADEEVRSEVGRSADRHGPRCVPAFAPRSPRVRMRSLRAEELLEAPAVAQPGSPPILIEIFGLWRIALSCC